MKELLIIVVGPSGAGKSIFIEAGIPESYRYVTSQPMMDELRRRGIEINHDTIFSLSQEWYAKDPYWQVPLILTVLKGKKFLIVDGPRRALEIKRLKELCRTIIVKIASNPENRFKWLKERKKIGLRTLEEFRRLEKDETKKMDIGELIEMADITVINNFSKKRHQKRGKRFGLMLKLLPSFLPRPFLSFLLKISVL